MDSDSISSLVPLMEVKSILTGKRGVSLPFTDYCEPILGEGVSLDQLLQEVNRYGKQHHWQWIQVRGGTFNGAEPEQQYYLHELALSPDTKKLFSNLRPAKRRNIRKAQSQEVQVEVADDRESMDIYYRLHCMTRKRHGVPPQPHQFFRNIFNYIISQRQGKILLARHRQHVVAGSIYFHFENKALYKFGASDMSFQHLRANDLVMWEAIKWYAEQGCRSFCFGRTSPNNAGLRRFKSDWGAGERVVSYYRYDLRQKEFVTAGTSENPSHQQLFRRMPVLALKLVGSVLYKHMG
jgi:lipid II:glycine glycyltransferase (peptidoglycan interpeptide bridge formation enzyme)